MGLTIGGRQSSRMISDVWLTPPWIVQALGPFSLDPCAAPEPRPWPTAERHICLPEDGLAARWEGRVWLNPPYSRVAERWLARMAGHGEGTALTFARTDTSWFTRYVWQSASALLFITGRLRFHRPDGSRTEENAGAPSVLAAYGPRDAEILGASGIKGTFVPRWEQT